MALHSGRPLVAVTRGLYVARAAMREAQEVQTRTHPTGEVARCDLLDRYAKAWVKGDARAVAALLRADTTLSVPPRVWLRGPSRIAHFLREEVFPHAGMRFLATRSNGMDAFGVYLRSPSPPHPFEPHSLQVVELLDGAVGSITCFLDPALLTRFGMPDNVSDSWPIHSAHES